MKKILEVCKSFFAVIVALWLCLGMLTISVTLVGSIFLDAGTTHVHKANMAVIRDDKDTAIEELTKAGKDGIVANYIAVGVYTANQILLPFQWDFWAEQRTYSLEQIEKIKNDLAVGYG